MTIYQSTIRQFISQLSPIKWVFKDFMTFCYKQIIGIYQSKSKK